MGFTVIPFELFAMWLEPGIQSTNRWVRAMAVTLIAFMSWLTIALFIFPQIIYEAIALGACFLGLYVVNVFYVSRKSKQAKRAHGDEE